MVKAAAAVYLAPFYSGPVGLIAVGMKRPYVPNYLRNSSSGIEHGQKNIENNSSVLYNELFHVLNVNLVTSWVD